MKNGAMQNYSEPPEDADSFHRIHLDGEEDIYSLKRALWSNQTLLIELNKLAKERNQLLESIRWIAGWSAVVLVLILTTIVWYK